MGSQTQPKLPVIDFSKENLKAGTCSWLSTCHDVRHALEEYGLFTAVFDKVPLELHNRIFHLAKELFDLPLETKVQNTSDVLGFGYGGGFTTMPLFEYSGIENAPTLEGTRSFTKLMWPAGNDTFCETALLYSKLISELGQMVVRMVFESYGVEKYYDSLIESVMYHVRFMKYQRPQVKETVTGLHPHTDKNFWTILDQNQVKGLEIETKDGKWIGFEPSPSSFVVIAGEPFMAWSNGRVHAPYHRVMMSGNDTKYTIGMFAFVSETVQTPEELVDDEHPLQFKPFDQFAYLQYCGEEGKNFKNPIKTYCGI
ncbi:hypothetical protein F0562_023003 [Nyssa sinensis]|uniref:Fe2OG dioxygenase domain-containing protein n=1 Tax=Nyssa sinensis TaxID=561372 RepID=A0A5J5BL21_9ASTE|nr:hypothetical protein F0562_023003 [Nyssa sinensis]